jgi:predicted nucleotidyltransferase
VDDNGAYPLLFAAISGVHLYGFPSPDSGYDLREAHVLPLDAVVGSEVRDETVQDSRSRSLKHINSPKTTSASLKR